jgi:hypothetical protein
MNNLSILRMQDVLGIVFAELMVAGHRQGQLLGFLAIGGIDLDVADGVPNPRHGNLECGHRAPLG